MLFRSLVALIRNRLPSGLEAGCPIEVYLDHLQSDAANARVLGDDADEVTALAWLEGKHLVQKQAWEVPWETTLGLVYH